MLKQTILVSSVVMALSGCVFDSDKSTPTKLDITASQSGTNTSKTNNTQSNATNTNTTKPTGTTTTSTNTTKPDTTTIDITSKVADMKKENLMEFKDDFGINVASANYTVRVGDKIYQTGDTVNWATHAPKNKVTDVSVSHQFTNVNGTNQQGKINEKFRVYRQDVSIIGGHYRVGIEGNIAGLENSKSNFEIDFAKGTATPEAALPKTGTYNYTGVAFSENEQGKLSYDVNFDKRVGSGNITGLNKTGRITLHEGSIHSVHHQNDKIDGTRLTTMGIDGKATGEKGQSGDYTAAFFGKNAEEIVGAIYNPNGSYINTVGDIGFGGKRAATPTK